MLTKDGAQLEWAPFSRRDFLRRASGGFGSLALAGILSELDAAPADPLSPRQGHFPAKADRVRAGDVLDVSLPAPREPLAVVAREELPRSVAFWRGQGFVDAGHEAPYLTLTRPLPLRDDVATADDMHRIGSRLAGVLRAGDVVVLTGELGAGKTTFTQGLGRGLGVRGDVT